MSLSPGARSTVAVSGSSNHPSGAVFSLIVYSPSESPSSSNFPFVLSASLALLSRMSEQTSVMSTL